MLGETKNQFSLTRVASSTCGRMKSKFLSVSSVRGLPVTVILDESNLHDTRSQLGLLASAGVPAWLDAHPRSVEYLRAHEKQIPIS